MASISTRVLSVNSVTYLSFEVVSIQSAHSVPNRNKRFNMATEASEKSAAPKFEYNLMFQTRDFGRDEAIHVPE